VRQYRLPAECAGKDQPEMKMIAPKELFGSSPSPVFSSPWPGLLTAGLRARRFFTVASL
jgi:hypothetical protein